MHTPQYETVNVQYDLLTEFWWVQYLDEQGWPMATPRKFKFQKQAMDHAIGMFQRGATDCLVVYDGDGNLLSQRNRVRTLQSI